MKNINIMQYRMKNKNIMQYPDDKYKYNAVSG